MNLVVRYYIVESMSNILVDKAFNTYQEADEYIESLYVPKDLYRIIPNVEEK